VRDGREERRLQTFTVFVGRMGLRLVYQWAQAADDFSADIRVFLDPLLVTFLTFRD
jgi:hypothetical protein